MSITSAKGKPEKCLAGASGGGGFKDGGFLIDD